MDSVLWSILRLSFVKRKFDSTLLPISFVKGYYFTFCYGFYLRVHPSQKTFISSDSNTTGITSRALPSYINGVPSSSRVLVDQDIVFYVVLYLSFFFVYFRHCLTIMLSVLRSTASNYYLFGIFKLFRFFSWISPWNRQRRKIKKYFKINMMTLLFQ